MINTSIRWLAAASIVGAAMSVTVAACEDENVSGNAKGQLTCSHGKVDCNGTCVSLASSPDNCGACGLACSSSMVCSRGSCDINCHAGLEKCGRSCVDTFGSSDNCGACGNVCEDGKTCGNSACVSSCPNEQTECDIGCVHTSYDPMNCGGCGIVCDAGNACVGGQCLDSSQCRFEVCSGACVDTTANNPQYCGGCDVHCGSGQVCEGECLDTCTAPLIPCNGVCVDAIHNPYHCGDECSPIDKCGAMLCDGNGNCVSACPPGYKQCGGSCLDDLSTNRLHCGECDNRCTYNEKCDNGLCIQCKERETLCNNECVVANTVDRCGSCDPCSNVSDPHALFACTSGSCSIVKCDDGFVDFNRYLRDGCEESTEGILHGTLVLGDGGWSLNCDPGYVDCNGDWSDGCEESDPPSAILLCHDSIREIVCKGGFFDCDGDITNGCEQDEDQELNGRVSKPHGVCVIDCDDGFDNCDHDLQNGCETSTREDPRNCGACGISCAGLHWYITEGRCLGGHCWGYRNGEERCLAGGLGRLEAREIWCPSDQIESGCCHDPTVCSIAVGNMPATRMTLVCVSNVPGMCFANETLTDGGRLGMWEDQETFNANYGRICRP